MDTDSIYPCPSVSIRGQNFRAATDALLFVLNGFDAWIAPAAWLLCLEPEEMLDALDGQGDLVGAILIGYRVGHRRPGGSEVRGTIQEIIRGPTWPGEQQGSRLERSRQRGLGRRGDGAFVGIGTETLGVAAADAINVVCSPGHVPIKVI